MEPRELLAASPEEALRAWIDHNLNGTHADAPRFRACAKERLLDLWGNGGTLAGRSSAGALYLVSVDVRALNVSQPKPLTLVTE